MKKYSELSNRSLKINKKRSMLTIFGIMLSTIIIFAIGTFILSGRQFMIDTERDMGGYQEAIFNNVKAEQIDKIKNNAYIEQISIMDNGASINYKDKMIKVTKYDSTGFERNFTYEINEGRKPKANSEILLQYQDLNKIGLKVGDEIKDNDGKTYKIVGTYKPQAYMASSMLTAYSFIEPGDIKAGNSYKILATFKDKQHITANSKEIVEALKDKEITIDYNKTLLFYYGDIDNNGFMKQISVIAGIVIGIIIISTITVIYNSFNISVIERIRDFGILKAIGTTSRQMRNMLLKEAAIMLAVALPAGILLGYISLYILVNVFLSGNLTLGRTLTIGIYPSIIIATIVLVILTTLVSIMLPIRKVSKISAVDAIKNVNEIRKEKLKKRKTRLISRIFGIEGSIAYKNIKRTPKRFIVTVLALTISIVVFNVFFNIVLQFKDGMKQLYSVMNFDGQIISPDGSSSLPDDVLKDIYKVDKIENIRRYSIAQGNMYFESKHVKAESNKKYKGFTKLRSANVFAGGKYEVDQCNKSLLEGKIDYDYMKKNNGVVLIDYVMEMSSEGAKVSRVTDYNVGDKIRIPRNNAKSIEFDDKNSKKIKESIDKNDFIELEVVALAKTDPNIESYSTSGIYMYMPQEVYNSNFNDTKINGILFDFKEGTSEEEISAIDKKFEKESASYVYINTKNQVDMIESIYSDASMFVYAFIIVITLISTVNIFNTISTNVLLRKKEFSTMKGIGLTDKQLSKVVILEGTLYGIVASLVGGTISFILISLIGNTMMMNPTGVQSHNSLLPFAISSGVAIIVTYLASVGPLKKIKSLSIVEGLREDN